MRAGHAPWFVALLLLAGCGDGARDQPLHGYVDADYVLVGAEATGRLTTLSVKRGDPVRAGATLFTLDDRDESSALAEAKALFAQGQASLADLKTGKRPEEIRVLDAQLADAEASLTVAQKSYQRNRDLSTRAVAEYVVEQMQKRIGDSIDTADEALKGGIDRATARRLLQRIVDVHIDSMLGEAEAELWGRFIMREQMEPSSTFDIIYDFMMKCQSTTTELIALLLNLDPRSEEATFRSFAISGQFVIFCVARPMVAKKLGRDTLACGDRDQIRRVVAEHIDLLVGETLINEE